jgi:hypothetical protein
MSSIDPQKNQSPATLTNQTHTNIQRKFGPRVKSGFWGDRFLPNQRLFANMNAKLFSLF